MTAVRDSTSASPDRPTTTSPGEVATSRAARLDRVLTGWTRRAWTREQVLAIGVVLVVVQLLYRAWVVFPAWFFLDDYVYLRQARDADLGAEYLLEAYAGHFMPGARLLVWLVAQTGPVPWATAATVSLVLQAAASVACLWALVRLFGARPGVLVPLAVYLSTALTLPGYVWWAAALNLLPVQAALFVAVAAWVEHLRTGSRRWLALAVLAVGLGMAFDVRGALALPVLGFVALAWFSRGGPVRRLLDLARTRGPGLGALVLVGAAYSGYYLLNVDQQTRVPAASDALRVASAMLGQTFPTALVGGPWRWEVLAPPTAFTQPPGALVALTWVVLTTLVLTLALRRTATLRAWVLLWGYAAILGGLVISSRSTFGEAIGREPRFLTETACLAALCLALATMPLPGAATSSRPREHPPLTAVPRSLPAGLLAVVVVGAVASSTSYARIWHTTNASDDYVHHLADGLRDAGAVDLAETPVPEAVLSDLLAPANTTRTLATLLEPDVDFPAVSPDLMVVDDAGVLRTAAVELGVASPPGPVAGCGWQVRSGEQVRVPLSGEVLGFDSWMRLGYLSGGTSPLRLSTSGGTVTTEVRRGLGSLYVKVDGGFDAVLLDGLAPGTDLCVDVVEVGPVVPGGAPP